MPVLHGGVAHVGELCHPLGGLCEGDVGITSTRMRVVLALLVVKVRAVAVLPSLRRKLFREAQASIKVPSTENARPTIAT
jgi:hypothetical protein